MTLTAQDANHANGGTARSAIRSPRRNPVRALRLNRASPSRGNWSTHNFYHADGNGNVTYLVNSSQALAASYRYDPYGNLISQSGTLASANVYRFSSKELHVNSGLYYYGYRWYDPNTQRWLNRDPISELGFMLGSKSQHVLSLDEEKNLYAFVFNKPVSIVDLDGLKGFWKRKWFPWNWPWKQILPPYDLPEDFPDISPQGVTEPGFRFKPWKPSCSYNFNQDWSIQGTYNPTPNTRDPYDREPESIEILTIRVKGKFP